MLPGSFTCEKCSEGLECPDLSSLVRASISVSPHEAVQASLKSGTSDLGEDYTPKIGSGYFSRGDAPLEAGQMAWKRSKPMRSSQVYRCGSEAVCPGGMPGSCAGGDSPLVGVPCAQCPEGRADG